jgi:hypothetical protein
LPSRGRAGACRQAGSDLSVCSPERGAVRPQSDPRRRRHSSARCQTGPAAGRQGLEALAHSQATLRRLPPAAAVPCPSRPQKENPIGSWARALHRSFNRTLAGNGQRGRALLAFDHPAGCPAAFTGCEVGTVSPGRARSRNDPVVSAVVFNAARPDDEAVVRGGPEEHVGARDAVVVVGDQPTAHVAAEGSLQHNA